MSNKSGDNFLSKNIVYLLGVGFLVMGIFAASGLQRYKENLFEMNYNVNIQKLNKSINMMIASNGDFFYSPMYTDDENPDYDQTSGEFLQKYYGVKKYCGSSNGDCFAKKYKDEKRKNYIPEYKGACAILNNGASICIQPQIKNNDITGIIDLNGESSPNVLGKDLRTFTIKAHRGDNRNNKPETDEITEIETP